MARHRPVDRHAAVEGLAKLGSPVAADLAAEILGGCEFFRAYEGSIAKTLELLELRIAAVGGEPVTIGLETLREKARTDPNVNASLLSLFGSRWDGSIIEVCGQIELAWRLPKNRPMSPAAGSSATS